MTSGQQRRLLAAATMMTQMMAERCPSKCKGSRNTIHTTVSTTCQGSACTRHAEGWQSSWVNILAMVRHCIDTLHGREMQSITPGKLQPCQLLKLLPSALFCCPAGLSCATSRQSPPLTTSWVCPAKTPPAAAARSCWWCCSCRMPAQQQVRTSSSVASQHNMETWGPCPAAVPCFGGSPNGLAQSHPAAQHA